MSLKNAAWANMHATRSRDRGKKKPGILARCNCAAVVFFWIFATRFPFFAFGFTKLGIPQMIIFFDHVQFGSPIYQRWTPTQCSCYSISLWFAGFLSKEIGGSWLVSKHCQARVPNCWRTRQTPDSAPLKPTIWTETFISAPPSGSDCAMSSSLEKL